MNRFEMLCDEKADEYMVLLEKIHLYEYREVDEIYNLIPEDHWLYYIGMDITDQREQLLLKESLNTLRDIFTKEIIKHDDCD